MNLERYRHKNSLGTVDTVPLNN